MYVDLHKLSIPIHCDESKVPMIYNCGVTAKEIKMHGPHIQPSLPKYEEMIDCLGSWSSAHFLKWKRASVSVDEAFNEFSKVTQFSLLNVGLDANKNFSNAQRSC